VAATAIGAVFLTQLEQVVLGMGAPSSLQLVIQGSIIALGMALRQVPARRVAAVLSGARSPKFLHRSVSLSLEGAHDPTPLEVHDDRTADRRPSTHRPSGSRRDV